MVFKSHRALGINILLNMQCKVLLRVMVFVRNYKACRFLENGVGSDMLSSRLSKCFKEQKAYLSNI